MIRRTWQRLGCLQTDPDRPRWRAWGAKIGEQNVDLGHGQYAPYVVDRQNRRVRFADCELRFTLSGLEIYRDGRRKNTLAFHPEINTDSWTRKSASKGNLAWAEGEEYVTVSYTLSTEDVESTISIKAGRGHKLHFSVEIHALKDGEQRLSLEFEEKGQYVTESTKSGQQLSRVEFSSETFWSWDVNEEADHKEIADAQRTRLSLKEKQYKVGQVERLSPDTWGPTDLTTNDDDGCDSDGSWEVSGQGGINYCSEQGDYDEFVGLSWELPAIAAGSTISEMYMRIYATNGDQSGTVTMVIRTEDSDPASAVIWASGHLPSNASWINTDMSFFDIASNSTYWGKYLFGEGDTLPKNLNGDLQDLVDTYGAISSGDRINIALVPNATGSDYKGFDDSSNGSNDPQLSIEWTEGDGESIVIQSTAYSSLMRKRRNKSGWFLG